ncbi:MAG: sulfatase-like hydrolase/transferase [Phycisphaerae bacterium]
MDSQLGRVLDCLRAHDLLKTTIVVVTGDHGEEFWEPDRWGHPADSFHETHQRVPFGLSPGAHQHRADGREHQDPSCLEPEAAFHPFLLAQRPGGSAPPSETLENTHRLAKRFISSRTANSRGSFRRRTALAASGGTCRSSLVVTRAAAKPGPRYRCTILQSSST